MQKLIQHLLHLVGNEKLLRKWENVSSGQAYRALFLSLATLTSVIVGVTVQLFVTNVAFAALAATASLPILFPVSIILVDKLQRGTFSRAISPELLNQRKILEYEYEQAIRQIESLGLPEDKKVELKIEQFKEFHKKLSELEIKKLN